MGHVRQCWCGSVEASKQMHWNQMRRFYCLGSGTKYNETMMERDKELYGRQIGIVDAQIDRLVYDLYGLTVEEVKVVEESFK